MPQYVQAYGQTIEFPDGMAQADIDAAIRKNALDISAASQARARESMKKEMGLDATGGGTAWMAGIGNGMASGIRALGGGSVLERFGLPGTKEEAEGLNRDLMNTTSGKIGTGLGVGALAAPLALVPGANTYAGAAALGALSGGALTEGDLAERAKGAAFGAAGGVAGKGLGDMLGWGASKLLSSRAAAQTAAQTAGAQKDAAAAMAQGAGYTIPPADIKTSFVNELLNGLGGKIKTAQEASARNQPVTNDLARQALGMSATQPLNAQALNQVRQQAGQAYGAVSNLGTIQPGQAYANALDAIVAPYMQAAKSFPGSKVNPVVEEINALRTPAFDAGDAVAKIRLLRADADSAYAAGNKEVGKSLKAGANALEQAIDDHLAGFGPSRLLNDFRAARQLIAKTYSVQKGLNDATGDVSAQALARQLQKGAPLSGELETIAQVGQAFPKATQALKEAPKAVSPLDWALAAITGASTGNPATVAMLGARPAARALQLSGPYQRAMTTNSYAPGLLDTVLLPNLSDDAMKLGLLGAGMTAGPMASR